MMVHNSACWRLFIVVRFSTQIPRVLKLVYQKAQRCQPCAPTNDSFDNEAAIDYHQSQKGGTNGPFFYGRCCTFTTHQILPRRSSAMPIPNTFAERLFPRLPTIAEHFG